MRRILSGTVAVLLALSQQAQAQSRCATQADQAVFDVQALKAKLTVLAITCRADERYNAFVEKYRPALVANERQFTVYFKGQKGGRSQAEQDSYVTSLVNSMSSFTTTEGTDFCGRNTPLFDEVMTLRSASELAPYAAGKNLFPASFGACVTNVVAEPTRRSSSPARAVKRK